MEASETVLFFATPMFQYDTISPILRFSFPFVLRTDHYGVARRKA